MKVGKLGAVAIAATLLTGVIVPNVTHAESSPVPKVISKLPKDLSKDLKVNMPAFEQLVIEVKEGKITNNDQATARLAELEAMNLPPKIKVQSRGGYILTKADEVAACIIAVGPYDTAVAKENADMATEDAAASGLPGVEDGKQDAFRHSLWNAYMSNSIGQDQAKQVADIHEKYWYSGELPKEMDLYNNQKGRDAYASLFYSGSSPVNFITLKTRVRSDLNKGYMKYINSDWKLVYTNQ